MTENIFKNDYFEFRKLTRDDDSVINEKASYWVNTLDKADNAMNILCHAYINNNGKKCLENLMLDVNPLVTSNVEKVNKYIEVLQSSVEFYNKLQDYFDREGFERI